MQDRLEEQQNEIQDNQNRVPERRILHHRVYLYLTEFFAGMSVMAVELGASRLLAPYFSSSQIVWKLSHIQITQPTRPTMISYGVRRL